MGAMATQSYSNVHSGWAPFREPAKEPIVAEFTSEKKALDNLVSYGMLRRDIADIIQKVADDKLAPVIEPEGPDCRFLMLLIDKSGSMEDLKKAVIDGQH